LVVIGDTLTLLLANQRMGDVSGPTVGLDDLAEVGAICSAVAVQGPVDDRINPRIRQPVVQKRRHGHFIGGIEYGWHGAPLLRRP
jgi:hypothetical protein